MQSSTHLEWKTKKNHDIMLKVFQKYPLSSDHYDSVANKAFYRCTKKHDDAKGRRFSSSLWKFMNWECQDQVRKNSRHNSFLKTYQPRQTSESGKDTEMIRDCIDAVDPDFSFILTKRYIDCMTLEELGESLSLSHMDVIELLRGAEEAFRQEWAC